MKELNFESVIDFIQKDFHRVNLKYGTSKETYQEWCNKFYELYPCGFNLTYEEFKKCVINRDEEFKEATLDYQI